MARPEVPAPQCTLVVDRFQFAASTQKVATMKAVWQYTNAADQSFANDVTLCNAFTDHLKTRMQPALGSDFSHLDGAHKNLSAVSNPTFHESHTAPWSGSAGVVSAPADSAMLIRQPALSGGKRGNGRSYLPGIQIGSVANGQQWDAGSVEAVADLWGFVLDDTEATMTGAGILGRFVLLHRQLGKVNLNPAVSDPFVRPMTDNFVGVQTIATQQRRSLFHRGRK